MKKMILFKALREPLVPSASSIEWNSAENGAKASHGGKDYHVLQYDIDLYEVRVNGRRLDNYSTEAAAKAAVIAHENYSKKQWRCLIAAIIVFLVVAGGLIAKTMGISA